MKIKFLTYALVATGMLCGAAFQASAQGGGGGGGGGRGGRGGMGAFANVMSAEDRQALTQAVQADTGYAKLRTDLQAAQKAAVDAALAKDAKESDVKAKLAAVAKVQADMALEYNKLVMKTVKFTDEQMTQLKGSTNAMSYQTIFGGGAGAGFGGGGGRRGGGGGGGGGFGGGGGGAN